MVLLSEDSRLTVLPPSTVAASIVASSVLPISLTDTVAASAAVPPASASDRLWMFAVSSTST